MKMLVRSLLPLLFGVALCLGTAAASRGDYPGYVLLEEKAVPEIRAVAHWFRHERSGAQVLYLQNDDDNKYFSIAFRTLPADSSGVAHILEHSVLCGSQNYPVKDPFATMRKSSLQTYLNASTFPDKTMYPVSSRNAADFRNLMDVYLDAVFHPLLNERPEIFAQEGWHYELDDSEAPLTIKGVVYNEMKGAYSSPESLLGRSIPASLLPDTIYRHSSGGDPERIPDLTREGFLDFYRRYYHPANSYIFLYGKLDLEDTLRFLDQKYLRTYTRQEVDSRITPQQPLPSKQELRLEYPVGAFDNTENRTYLSMNFVIGQAGNRELIADFSRLENLLLGSNDAPLKKAILKAGIGREVYGSFSTGRLQPIFSIIVVNANEDQKDKLETVVRTTLEELAAGIDREVIRAAFAAAEFRRRETPVAATNRGLLYNQISLGEWLYGGSPIAPLAYRSRTEQKALAGGYFEGLIRQYLLNNPEVSTVTVGPRPGLEEERTALWQARLASYRESLSAEERRELVQQTRQLREWQETPDTPEDIARMPVLKRQDINPRAEPLLLEAHWQDGVTVLHHPAFTNEITYLELYFDSSGVSAEQLPYLHLLTQVLGRVNTGRHSYVQLDQQIKAQTGGISWEADAFSGRDSDESFAPKLIVHFRALNEKRTAAAELLEEIIADSRFDDRERLCELIGKCKARWQSWVLNDGSGIVASRVEGYSSPVGSYREAGALSFYHFLEALERDFDAKEPEIRRNLEAVRDLAFRRPGMLAGITVDAADYPRAVTDFAPLWRNRNPEKAPSADWVVAPVGRNEGLVTASKVQYVARAYNFRRLGYEYSGNMRVLQTILSTDYLWNRVRVRGGAYGAAVRMDRTGNVLLWSWRDPQLQETLSAYDDIVAYLRAFSADEQQMTNYIIATIGRLDAPMSPHARGEMAAAAYIRGIGNADLQQERDEILATTAEDIRRYAEMFAEMQRQDYFCVLGGEGVLKKNRKLFDALVRVVH